MIGLLIALLLQQNVSEQAKNEARIHYKKGNHWFDATAYADAIDEYEAAYKLFPSPRFLYNIAQAYRLKGDAKNAVVYYQRFVEAQPTGEGVKEAREFLKKLGG